MMLCEETVAVWIPVQTTQAQLSTPVRAPRTWESVADQCLPKNKAARRRFIQSIHDNIDQVHKDLKDKSTSYAYPTELGRLFQCKPKQLRC